MPHHHETNIMIVEDESIISFDIAHKLKNLGLHICKICSNGSEAVAYIKKEKIPSVILMDIDLKEDMNGIEAAEKILNIEKIPIIYLTASTDDFIIEKALQTNPSAYLTKPFDEKTLFAAIKIALRSAPIPEDQKFVYLDKSYKFSLKLGQLYHHDNAIKLTKKETELLTLLITRKNQIVPFDIIETCIWPDKIPNESTLRALVNRLRAKLEGKFIENHSGLGYRIDIKS